VNTPGTGTDEAWEWSNNPPLDAPYEYQVPGSLEVQPFTSTATYDGTDAEGDFIPVLTVYSQTGAILARVFPQATVKAGDGALVTFVPPFGSSPSSPSPGSTATGTYCIFATPETNLASGAVLELDLTTGSVQTNDRTGAEEFLGPPVPAFSGTNFSVNPGANPNQVVCKNPGAYWIGIQLQNEGALVGPPASWSVIVDALGPLGPHELTAALTAAFPGTSVTRTTYGEVGIQQDVATQTVQAASAVQLSGVAYTNAVLFLTMIYLGPLV
jgi:hypothetical protein